MTRKEIKARFNQLVYKPTNPSGLSAREFYLARAFLLDIPYSILEQRAETEPNEYAIQQNITILLGSGKCELYKEIKYWIWKDAHAGKTKFGQGVSPYSYIYSPALPNPSQSLPIANSDQNAQTQNCA
jgi:hypothetical protein